MSDKSLMDKSSDNDDLGFVAHNSGDDDLGFQPHDSSLLELQKQPGYVESLLRGAGQGLTAGFGDELTGAAHSPLGAIKSIPGINKLVYKGDEDVANYAKARDASREANTAAHETNPAFYNTGDILGSLVPGAALAKGAGAAQATSALGKALQAGSTGAKFGAIAGLGNSTASDLPGAAQDVAMGAGIGAATGAGLSGLGSAASGLSDLAQKTHSGKLAATAFGLGKEGNNLLSQAGRTAVQNEAYSTADAIAGKNGVLPKMVSKAGKAIGTALDKADEIDLADENPKSGQSYLSDIMDKINDLSDKDEQGADKEALMSRLRDRLNTAPVEAQEFTPEAQPQEYTKVRKSFDNSPKGMQQAQGQVAKLNAKAEIEGTPERYEVMPDQKNGFFHVVEKGVEDSDVPPTAGDVYQVAPGSDNTSLQPSDVQDLKQSLQNFSQFGKGQSQSPQGDNASKAIAGLLGDASEANNPDLASANQDYANLMQNTLKPLGLNKKGGGMLSDADRRVQKLGDMIGRLNNQTKVGNKARYAFGEAMKGLADSDPQAASELTNQAQTTANRVETANSVGHVGFSTNPLDFIKGNVNGVANVAGFGAGKISQYLTKLPAQQLTSMGSKLSASSNPMSQKLGGILTEVAGRDQIGRNAMMFSLMQNASYRQILSQEFGFDKQDNAK